MFEKGAENVAVERGHDAARIKIDASDGVGSGLREERLAERECGGSASGGGDGVLQETAPGDVGHGCCLRSICDLLSLKLARTGFSFVHQFRNVKQLGKNIAKRGLVRLAECEIEFAIERVELVVDRFCGRIGMESF